MTLPVKILLLFFENAKHVIYSSSGSNWKEYNGVWKEKKLEPLYLYPGKEKPIEKELIIPDRNFAYTLRVCKHVVYDLVSKLMRNHILIGKTMLDGSVFRIELVRLDTIENTNKDLNPLFTIWYDGVDIGIVVVEMNDVP